MSLVSRRRLTMHRTMQRRKAADLRCPVAPSVRRWQELAWGWGLADHLRRKLRSCRGRSCMARVGRSLRLARRRRGLGRAAAGTGPGRRWRKRRGEGACRPIDKVGACGTAAGSRRGGEARMCKAVVEDSVKPWRVCVISSHPRHALRFFARLRVSATCP